MARDEFPESDWPTFGWVEDVRPAMAEALGAGRGVALATLFRVEGSAPRGPGAQMLFDGERAFGYFSGGCVEADVALHAAEVLRDGMPRELHYGTGSPWIDIRLRCGGAIHILVERVGPNSAAAHELIARGERRSPALWISDGMAAQVEAAGAAPLLGVSDKPFRIARRHDPGARLIVSGWDPTALAIARLAAEAQVETFLVRPHGPRRGPGIEGVAYLRGTPAMAFHQLGLDRWTAFVGAMHESDLDIPACAAALAGGAGYVGLVGAASRLPERTEAILAAGAPEHALARLDAPAGVRSLGKTPSRIALGVVLRILEAIGATPET